MDPEENWRKRPCCCKFDWCSKLRAIHPWRNSSVPFPSRVNFAYFKETRSALQIDENDEWQIGESSWIWIAHYHAVDTKERSNGIMLKNIQKTNFFYGTRNSKNDGGPIPDVSMVEIENGCISNRKRKDRSEGSIAASSSGPVSSFEVGGSNDHQQFEAQRIAALIDETPVLSSFDTPAKNSEKKTPIMVTPATSNSGLKTKRRSARILGLPCFQRVRTIVHNQAPSPKQCNLQRKLLHSIHYAPPLGKKKRSKYSKTPLGGAFIGTSDCVFDLMQSINAHGRFCEGLLSRRSRDFRQHGLSLKVKCTCSRGEKCRMLTNTQAGVHLSTQWSSHGTLTWRSCSMVSDGLRDVPIVNAKFAYGVTMCQVSRRGAECLMRAMQLKVPSRSLQNRFVNNRVRGYVLGKKSRIMDKFADELRNAEAQTWSADTGHNHSRNSQAATLSLAQGGQKNISKTVLEYQRNACTHTYK